MTFIKINEKLYPATVSGRIADKEWDNRSSKSIALEMPYAEAINLFVDGLGWSIIQHEEVPTYDENGEQTGTEAQETEFDNSEYNLAGDITDHRDGTITVKMGALTPLEEAYELLLGDEDLSLPTDIEPSEEEEELIPEDTEAPETDGEPVHEETEPAEVEGEDEPIVDDITEGGNE